MPGRIGPAGLVAACRFLAGTLDQATGGRFDKLEHPCRLFRRHTIMNCFDTCPRGLDPSLATGTIKEIPVARVVQERRLPVDERGMAIGGKADSRALERLRWRSRRGLLELDLILTRFLQTRLETLSQEEIGILEEVLWLSDNDFLDLLMGRVECLDQRIKPMIDMIRAA